MVSLEAKQEIWEAISDHKVLNPQLIPDSASSVSSTRDRADDGCSSVYIIGNGCRFDSD